MSDFEMLTIILTFVSILINVLLHKSDDKNEKK